MERTNPFGISDDETDGPGEFESKALPGSGSLIELTIEHWTNLCEIMSPSLIINPFALEEFQHHLISLAEIISRERSDNRTDPKSSECVELMLNENILEKVCTFATRQKKFSVDIRHTLVSFFTNILTIPGPSLIIHQQILRPLNRLLLLCDSSGQEKDISLKLIPLLYHICLLIQENESFLDLFFIDGAGRVPSKFLVFTLLVPYVHDMTEKGATARDALLMCLSVAARSPQSRLSDFIVGDTDFCQVLATGLSGLYSSLPMNIELPEDNWLSPLSHLLAVPGLKKILASLSFCNSVLQMAPLLVCQGILLLIKNGFLKQVIGPAMFQNSPDGAAVAVGYLCVFLNNITNVQLMGVFVQFITLGKCDDKSIINCLVQYILSESNKLASVALELLYTLVNLNCEDVMLILILQYLLLGQHITPHQLQSVANRDLYCIAARRFLFSIPSCCTKSDKLLLESLAREEYLSSIESSFTHNDSHELSSSPVKITDNNSPVYSCLPSTMQKYTTSTFSDKLFQQVTPELSYYNFLAEAHSAIEKCTKGCWCWSSLYDKTVVSTNIDVAKTSHTQFLIEDHSSQGTLNDHDIPDPVMPVISQEVFHKPPFDISCKDRFTNQAGLFLKTLCIRLSGYLGNSLIVNQLLLKLISRLAHYPQPLIRSFLLNHHLVLRPGVPNFFSVLQNLKADIDKLAEERDNFEFRLGRARKTIIYNATVGNEEIDESASSSVYARSESRLSHESNDSFKEDKATHPIAVSSVGGRKKKKSIKVTINMVYSIILFGDFLKELAALSQQHSVIYPQNIPNFNEYT